MSLFRISGNCIAAHHCSRLGSAPVDTNGAGLDADIRAGCLVVEVHPSPEKIISDGAQSLDLVQFEKMMLDLQPYIELWEASRKGEALAAAS